MRALNRNQAAAFGVGVTLALFSMAVSAAESGTAYAADGFPATAFEYARMIEPELGVPPRIDPGKGVEIPLYVKTNRG